MVFDTVWADGGWRRSPTGDDHSPQPAAPPRGIRQGSPVFTQDDIRASPYCHPGLRRGLAPRRTRRASAGPGRRRPLRLGAHPRLRANHVAMDHDWVVEQPRVSHPGRCGGSHPGSAGVLPVRRPHFRLRPDPKSAPGRMWPSAHASTGLREAPPGCPGNRGQCDGVRCDNVHPVINRIFQKTWGSRAGREPQREYWVDVIGAVRDRRPDITFIAEAYWDLERELQQQGFDYCYDKRLYDRLLHEPAEAVRLHLSGDPDDQHRLLRFIENHDEPRAASVFGSAKGAAAAVVVATLPGARLFHDGQLEGRKVKLPVHARPQPEKRRIPRHFRLFTGNSSMPCGMRGSGRGVALCEISGWPTKRKFPKPRVLALVRTDRRHLIVANLSARRSQARVRCRGWSLPAAPGGSVILVGDEYERDGNEMATPGSSWTCRPGISPS